MSYSIHISSKIIQNISNDILHYLRFLLKVTTTVKGH